MEILELLKENVTLDILYKAFTICVTFDVLTGVIKAWKTGRLKSRTLRDGLFGSVGELITLLLCIIATSLIPLLGTIVFTLILFMILKELYSIIENLIVIGVKFPNWMVKGLQVYTDQLDQGSKGE